MSKKIPEISPSELAVLLRLYDAKEMTGSKLLGNSHVSLRKLEVELGAITYNGDTWELSETGLSICEAATKKGKS